MSAVCYPRITNYSQEVPNYFCKDPYCYRCPGTTGPMHVPGMCQSCPRVMNRRSENIASILGGEVAHRLLNIRLIICENKPLVTIWKILIADEV